MGVMKWLFRSTGLSRSSRGSELRIIGCGDHDYEIVGEARHPVALSAICGGPMNTRRQRICCAVLAEERDDPRDPDAVGVSIEARLVGHLPPRDAQRYKKHLRRRGYQGRRVLVGAVIIVDPDADARGPGGFVVKLDMSMPPDIVEV